ncbi:DUF2958 domain-containing protein [Novosphingobium rosa]|uniref:DUF2958 domain-containing protein n=1 Tax=Novosphingobium rosa TaxID=76978 RepID=UPI000B10F418|nr:DUF2958 domain-containing protein [Novosphingobium rosa]
MADNYVKQSNAGAAQCGTGKTRLNITRCSTYFGLADLGFGCPELGSFSLHEIGSVRLPFGLQIERDLYFSTPHPLSVWTETAHQLGSIAQAEIALRRLDASPVSRPH